MSGDVTAQVVSVDLLDIGSGTEDGAAQCRALVGIGMKVVEYNLLNLLVHFLRWEGQGRGEQGFFQEFSDGGKNEGKGVVGGLNLGAWSLRYTCSNSQELFIKL